MLSTNDLLAAAMSGAKIGSFYRLARQLETSDQTIYRWRKDGGYPDDTFAAKLATMAGLDVAWVVVSMKAARERDDALRAIWVETADRLLLTSGMPPRHDGGGTPPGGSEAGSDGPTDDETASDGGALMSSTERTLCAVGTPETAARRQAKAALARARRALKKSQAH